MGSEVQKSNVVILNSLITGFVAIAPPGIMNFVEKLLSVLVLAMAAELGRRLIGIVWRNSK
jgi:hypothetical protein